MKELNLFEYLLTEISESDLIALCQLNNIKPNELNFLMLGNNKLTDLNFITENTVFINLETLNISGNYLTNIDNIKYLTKLKKLNLAFNSNLKDIEVLKDSNIEELDIFLISVLETDNWKEILNTVNSMKKLKKLKILKLIIEKYPLIKSELLNKGIEIK